MFTATTSISGLINDFQINERMMRYNLFVPKLVNLCASLGFEHGKVMPSRAFCSDESQGYPIILLTKHFGAFPFNHGRVGGIVATGRHAPHAEHGKDMVIIQASHVGYEPESQQFGVYRRIHTADNQITPSCGKIGSILHWYQKEYAYATNNITLEQIDGRKIITIDNQLLGKTQERGLSVTLAALARLNPLGEPEPYKVRVTGKSFLAADQLIETLGIDAWPADGSEKIGTRLGAGMFHFNQDESVAVDEDEGKHHIENNLLPTMPWIVTSDAPYLTAAKINSQVEFDRVFRTILREKSYRGKQVFLLSGLNIDISPSEGELFPITKFIPWAAFYCDEHGEQRIYEQDDIFNALESQPDDNPNQIDLEQAINISEQTEAVEIKEVSQIDARFRS